MLDLAVVAAAINNFMLNTSADATAQLHHGTPALFTLPHERQCAPAILAIKCWLTMATSIQSNLHTQYCTHLTLGGLWHQSLHSLSWHSGGFTCQGREHGPWLCVYTPHDTALGYGAQCTCHMTSHNITQVTWPSHDSPVAGWVHCVFLSWWQTYTIRPLGANVAVHPSGRSEA